MKIPRFPKKVTDCAAETRSMEQLKQHHQRNCSSPEQRQLQRYMGI